jgi:hypothetical protein
VIRHSQRSMAEAVSCEVGFGVVDLQDRRPPNSSAWSDTNSRTPIAGRPVTRFTPSANGHTDLRGAARLSSADAGSGAPARPPSSARAPIHGGHFRVRDLTIQCFGELLGDPVYVLRPRAGEFVDPAQVRPGLGQYGSDHPGDISAATGEVLPRPNGSSIRPRSRPTAIFDSTRSRCSKSP